MRGSKRLALVMVAHMHGMHVYTQRRLPQVFGQYYYLFH